MHFILSLERLEAIVRLLIGLSLALCKELVGNNQNAYPYRLNCCPGGQRNGSVICASMET